MRKPTGAAYSDGGPAQFAEVANSVFQHLGEASERLMQLQAQAATVVMMQSAARYAEVVEDVLQNFRPRHWRRVQRSQWHTLSEPMHAWIEASTGLQVLMAAAFMQAFALMLFPANDGSLYAGEHLSERRVTSVVIPFPDRRRHDAA